MKFLLVFLCLASTPAFAAGKKCVCTCVVKDDEGKITTLTGQGKDREAAGEALKKALGKKKCELSPDCTGAGCKLDE